MLFFTPNGLVRQANSSAKQILGFASPVGMSAAEMFRDAELISASDGSFANLAEAVDASLREKIRFRQLEARYRTPAGEERTLDITVSSVHAPDSEVLGAACLINDRTEMTEIRRQQELRGEMSAEMALELRNSLTTISGYAQQLAASRDPELARQLAADIAAEAAHLDRTIGGFLRRAQKLRGRGRKFECRLTSMLPRLFKAAGRKEMEHRMKRIAYVFLAEIVLTRHAGFAGGRAIRASGRLCPRHPQGRQKESGKKYDNDNLPTTDKISVVGNAARTQPAAEDANPARPPTPTPRKPADSSTAATPDAAQDATKKADGADAQKANDQWKQKIRRSEGQGRSARPRTGRDPARISPACRRLLRRRRQSPAQPGLMGQGRRPIQTADRPETKSRGRRQESTGRHEGTGPEGGSSGPRPRVDLFANSELNRN